MKVGDKKRITLNSGKEAYLVVYHMNPLVIGWELDSPYNRSSWKKQKEKIALMYNEEFPENLKDLFKLEDLHNLTLENLVTEIPNWVKPINSYYSFKLDYFPDFPLDKNCKERGHYNYWLENDSSGSVPGFPTGYGCYINKNGTMGYGLWGGSIYTTRYLRPAFFIKKE